MNEFVIKNGFISKGNSIVEGGLTATTISASTISAPGSNTQVIYNNGGVLGADTGFVYSGSSVGIGTTTPSEKLDVSGKTKTISLQVTSGATSGYVLTSDVSGNATWQIPSVTADTYTTGFTYNNNTFTISDNSGSTYNATINSVTGLTVNGILSATTISGGTLYGDGSNLTGLSTGLNVGTTQITNGTDTRVLFQSGTTLQQDGNFTFDPTLKQLTLRAGGTLSTDIPFRIRNSGNTANLITQQGDGMLLIGSGTLDANDVYFRVKQGTTNYVRLTSGGGVAIGAGSQLITASATPDGVAIGTNASATSSGGGSWSVAIGRTATALTSSVAIGGNTNAGTFSGPSVAIGSSITSSGIGTVVIGSSSSTGNLSNSVVLIGDNVNINATNYNRIHSLGSFISHGASALNNIITLGGGTGTGVNLAVSTIPDSFNIYLGATERSFFVNKNSNVVLRSLQSLTSGTNFDASATNTITISTGTTPSTNIIDSAQIYVTDRGGTAGRASTHFRSEDGTINVLGDLSGIGTSSPQARLDVRAQGALSTDIAFRVRNSADSADLFQHRGDGYWIYRNSVGNKFIYWDGDREFQLGVVGNQTLTFSAESTGVTRIVTTSGVLFQSVQSHAFLMYNNGNFQLEESSGILQTSGRGGLSLKNAAVIPSTNTTDRFIIYSADRGGVAGKASAHFRAEDGTINVIGDLSGFGTSAPGARLDVRAQGALSTDIVFRVRNSGDTANLFEVRGNGSTLVTAPANGFTSGFAVTVGGQARYSADEYRGYLSGIHYVDTLGRGGSDSIGFYTGLGVSNQLSVRPQYGSISLGSISHLGDGGNTLYIKNTSNVAFPTPSSIVDGIAIYSADIVAGNAAPHFRTENGAIIKVYQETTAVAASTLVSNGGTTLTNTDTFDGYTLQQVVKALRNLGILQ